MKKILLTLLFIAPLSLFAQITGTIRGIIIEDETDEADATEGEEAPVAEVAE